jgi:hypothetical protein
MLPTRQSFLIVQTRLATKNIFLIFRILLDATPKSPLQLPPSRPERGALAIVTNVGAGCGGRGSVGRVVVLAGRALVREQTQRADDWRGCVRQKRVVPASVADVKLAETRRPDRAQDKSQSAGDGDKKEFVAEESAP